MPLHAEDWQALWLTARLAATTTVLLLLMGTPIAWWLAHTRSALKGPVAAVVALPLVLPPTVIGFYLLVLLGPQGPVGQFMQAMGMVNDHVATCFCRAEVEDQQQAFVRSCRHIAALNQQLTHSTAGRDNTGLISLLKPAQRQSLFC